MNKSKKLVFFGSGPVAAKALKLLVNDFNIEAIITKPKPSHHKGNFPVLDLVKELGLKAFTPTNKQELLNLFKKNPVQSQLGLVIDYGIIIPKAVIDYFPLGIINSHFSLLPKWRGADPITFAILNGDEITGVSLMLINEKLDEGLLLDQQTLVIPTGITTPELTDALIKLSHVMLREDIPKYLAGELKPYSQQADIIEPTYSRKLTKEDGTVDWRKPALRLEREVRAYAGWPKSTAKIFGHEVIVTKARVAKNQNDGNLIIECQPDYLEILELVGPSGKTMTGGDFLHGYKK